jgi:serine O-acetyltransferase
MARGGDINHRKREIKMSPLESRVRGFVQHYDEDKYWKYRDSVIHYNPSTGLRGYFRKIQNIWYLFYIKRCDAFNNASLGTHLGFGAHFETRPSFPHGLYGIIVSHEAVIGKNCVILHQVTIGVRDHDGGCPVIGDNCLIGAGAKIIGNVHIGNNVKIGANSTVTKDVPDNATVVPTNRYITR